MLSTVNRKQSFATTFSLMVVAFLITSALPAYSKENKVWLKVNNFESANPLDSWTKVDTQNETTPKVENPQVTEVRLDSQNKNHYLIKKPASEGIIGNRKAISFTKLPKAIDVGETYTFYLRLNVESFPNNHVFGLTSLGPQGIIDQAYNALEPSLRITDRFDPNINYQQDGTLLVRKDDWYDRIYNSKSQSPAKPMETDTWYEVWMVVNNKKIADGGQVYDVYIRGGKEFPTQQKVYSGADFRMKREVPIMYFSATCNTGSVETPYGNGGLRYDDLYMTSGLALSSPLDTHQ